MSAGLILIIGAALLLTIYFPSNSGLITELSEVAMRIVIILLIVGVFAGALYETLNQ